MLIPVVRRLNDWFAARDDPALSPRARLDGHVLRGATVMAWVLAVSLLGLHLPTMLLTDASPASPTVIIVLVCGLFSFGVTRLRLSGERLSAAVLMTGVVSLLATTLVDESGISPHLFLGVVPMVTLTMAAVAPVRPRWMLALGGAVAAAELALAGSGRLGADSTVHAFLLSITANGVAGSILICHLRRVTLVRLYEREIELHASHARTGRLLEDLRRAQMEIVASERVALLGRVGSGLAHELKSPLAALSNGLLELRGLAREVLESAGDPDVDDADVRAIAADMMQTLDIAETAERRVMHRLKRVVGGCQGSAARPRVPFSPLQEIRTMVELFEHERERLGVVLETRCDPAIELPGSRAAFAHLVSQLLDRALRVSAGTSARRVVLEVEAQGNDAVLRLTDSAAPLTPDERERLFLPSDDADTLNLYVARDVAEQTFGGSLVGSSLEDGNALVAKLPMGHFDRPPSPTMRAETP